MATPPPRGIYVPVPTFFASKSASNYDSAVPPLDTAVQVEHAVHLARAGITGLVLLGSTGEAVHLTSLERVQLISAVRQGLSSAGFPNYPLLAGTATQSIEDAVTQLSEAQKAGAQWGMCLAPGYFATAVSQAGIATWFEAVADRSPIPILVYHYPAVSNHVVLLPTTMQRLAAHSNIVGCKLSHGNLDDHALIALNPNIDHERFYTFTGLGQQLLGVLSVGGAGAIDGLAAVFPRSIVRLYDLFRLQEEHVAVDPISIDEAIRTLQYNICQGEKLVVKWGTVGIREAVARVLHFGDGDGGRWPLKGGFPAGDAEWESWSFAVESLQASEVQCYETSDKQNLAKLTVESLSV